MSKFVVFEEGTDKTKKQHWFVKNKKTGEVLGFIGFYPNWKKWVLEAQPNVIWDSVCLKDVVDFISKLK